MNDRTDCLLLEGRRADTHRPVDCPSWCWSCHGSTEVTDHHMAEPREVPATAGRWYATDDGAMFPHVGTYAQTLSGVPSVGLCVTMPRKGVAEVDLTPGEARRLAAALVAASYRCEAS